MSRIEMQKPNGQRVSVPEANAHVFEDMGYTVYQEPEAPKAYNEIISEPEQTSNQSEIMYAIHSLSPDDFSKSTGKPNVKAIEEVLGYDIKAKERDAAWAEYSAQ
ncbi:hypothetical protein [uncultured Paraglaciecola sp.]|uniref:hypothetical protein n=1 Tax=uncultured Paraglaciecola sp. TaxID=1765024 RepID=UPI0026173AB1|nr:hypothetical protein [uncultured Paraglaciecola sp.]